jgi:DNA topoisomerase-1
LINHKASRLNPSYDFLILLSVSQDRIPNKVDKAMDKASAKAKLEPPGISIRNGPVLDDAMDIDEPSTNGASKRKSRTSTGKPVNYNDGSDGESDDAVPLVCR